MGEVIPKGTRIYLTKKIPGNELSLKLDTNLLNDNLYVLYDVKIGPQIVIPKGTRVVGDWITQTTPDIAAQLQLSQIYINGNSQPICADSNIIRSLTVYNGADINYANTVKTDLVYRSTANIIRRIVNVQCKIKVLSDTNNNIVSYLSINTTEIPVELLEDFNVETIVR